MKTKEKLAEEFLKSRPELEFQSDVMAGYLAGFEAGVKARGEIETELKDAEQALKLIDIDCIKCTDTDQYILSGDSIRKVREYFKAHPHERFTNLDTSGKDT